MLDKHTLPIVAYLKGKYAAGIIDYFSWNYVGFSALMAIGVTKIIYHKIIRPEFQQFCDEYSLVVRTDYLRLHPGNPGRWRISDSTVLSVPADEIMRIDATFTPKEHVGTKR